MSELNKLKETLFELRILNADLMADSKDKDKTISDLQQRVKELEEKLERAINWLATWDKNDSIQVGLKPKGKEWFRKEIENE